MSREDELASVREQVSILAEQVARLMDVISIRSRNGWSVKPYEEKLALVETMMWKLHRRQTRLKSETQQAAVMQAAE
jgi:hypothetical protein